MLHQGEEDVLVTKPQMREATDNGFAAIEKVAACHLRVIWDQFHAHDAELNRTDTLRRARSRVPFHNQSPSPCLLPLYRRMMYQCYLI